MPIATSRSLPERDQAGVATRFRLAIAQPWIDAFAEFGVIPASFSASTW